jgi:uncharacterized membrane protein HdeD (DUF308 family)
MRGVIERPSLSELRAGSETLRRNRFWIIVPSIALIVLGCVAIRSVVIASLATAMTVGILLLLGGVGEAIGAFLCRGWIGFYLLLLSGVLSIVIGALFLQVPLDVLLAFTLLIACILMVGGGPWRAESST